MKTLKALKIPALFAISLLAVSACRGKHQRTTVQNEEAVSAPRLVSILKMGDAATAGQLRSGFYAVESGSWRWTAGHFSLVLRVPLGSAQRGATLKFGFTVPEVTTKNLGAVTLTASIGQTKLKTEKYAATGSYSFAADVPAELLTRETVTVDFALDKSMAPKRISNEENRELGVIASTASLESK